MAKLTFLGAAGSVTGSKYLLESEGKRLLVDCGLFQGNRELKDRNWKPLPIDPKTIDWCVLTHAHLDHTGWLPRLVKDAYRNPIYANAAIIEVRGILLRDSGHIQEEDAEHAQAKKYSRHEEPLPLYTEADVEPVMKLFREIPRTGSFTISPQFAVRSYDAGHILGSSSLEITVTEGGKTFVIVFSGDIGRYEQPILNNPATPPRADFLLCESTYGDRDHPGGSPLDALADVVNRVSKRGGSIVIPAFAVGRTQTMMYILRELEDAQRIPHLPVYIDSPMAITATDLYLRHHGEDVAVRAEVVELRQFSAHAGKSELLRWLGAFQAPPKQTFLVHGEPAAAAALKASIETQMKWNVSIARYLDTVTLGG